MNDLRQYKILVVDDDKDIADLLVFNIEQAGYRAETANTGEEAVRKVRDEKPDLIVLDLMLPGISGQDVSRILKSDSETSSIPIIMLTAKSAEEDIVNGFELGADDYVTKPFSPKVLLARIKSALKRTRNSAERKEEKMVFNEIEIYPGKRIVKINGEQISLTYSEFEILSFLLKHRGWVFSRDEIVNNIRGDNYLVTERAVDVQIVGLRKKLGEAAKYVKTVRGVGYKFSEE